MSIDPDGILVGSNLSDALLKNTDAPLLITMSPPVAMLPYVFDGDASVHVFWYLVHPQLVLVVHRHTRTVWILNLAMSLNVPKSLLLPFP